MQEIEQIRISGNNFLDIQDFVKQSIIDAFASTTNLKVNARDQIRDAIKNKIGKNVSIATRENERKLNSFYLAKRDSFLQFKVRGIDIFFFTHTEDWKHTYILINYFKLHSNFNHFPKFKWLPFLKFKFEPPIYNKFMYHLFLKTNIN